MPHDYRLRPARPDDLESLMAIGHEGLRPYVEALWGWDREDQRRRFRESFDWRVISVVQIEGRDVGYLRVEDGGDHIYLAGIYVDADHRGSGLGTRLLTDLIARAHAAQRPLRLRVLVPNAAYRLYERLGFRRTSEDATHIYMELDPDDG